MRPLRSPGPVPIMHPIRRLSWQALVMVADTLLSLACLVIPVAGILRRLRRGSGIPGLRYKCFGPSADLPSGRVVVHGVSLGEVGLMGLVVPELERVWRCSTLLTSTTDTGWQALQRHWQHHPRAWWPFDLPWAVERFLAVTRPRAVVLLELELWPRMLMACHRRGIPVYVVNARVSERSYRGYRRARGLIAPLLRPVPLALAQNARWGAHLRALGCQQVQVSGSLKADLVRLAAPDVVEDVRQRLNLDSQRPILLVASTSDDEERPCIKAWREACPDWQLVLCPRHPERGAQVAQALAHSGARLPVWRWSNAAAEPSADAVRIVDAIGHLSALYALADIAIVGGSLGSGRHGQNMLEAAAHGCATVVGMDTSNFPDAMTLLREANGVVETSVEDLAACLRRLTTDSSERERLAAAGRAGWRAACGSTQRCQRLLARVPPRIPR
ncbi:MAG: hypothetical protein EA401_07620 [Planctomycetota bacterium]|nr:MAG: hypothetical protein EA401_07620 [Planctomycetota bacterium]